jgi:hypothetical protein
MKQLLWVAVLGLLAACSKGTPPTEPAAKGSIPVQAAGTEDTAANDSTPGATQVQASTHALPEAAQVDLQPADAIDLRSLFGAQIELARDLPANEFRGDLTGDGVEDRAFLVLSSTFPPNLAPDIQVLQPFQKTASKVPDVRGGPPVSLVIVNGGPNFPVATLIMYDAVLNGRLAVAVRLGIHLVKKAELGSAPIAQQAQGDVLVLPGPRGTEDCFYWDGATYRLASLVVAR